MLLVCVVATFCALAVSCMAAVVYGYRRSRRRWPRARTRRSQANHRTSTSQPIKLVLSRGYDEDAETSRRRRRSERTGRESPPSERRSTLRPSRASGHVTGEGRTSTAPRSVTQQDDYRRIWRRSGFRPGTQERTSVANQRAGRASERTHQEQEPAPGLTLTLPPFVASIVDLGDKLLESFRAPPPPPVVSDTVPPAAAERLGSAVELPAPTSAGESDDTTRPEQLSA